MKHILYLFAVLVTASTTAFATNSSSNEANTTAYNYVRGYGNSFIFMEAGIEFSVFPDGQFDFYMPQYGPNVNVGINRPGFSLSFNTGFNYNPYVQYDSFGAIVQIENTPIYYDFYGRVNQIGNIFINYNGFGRVNRIGGLNIFYRNNVFWRYDGFINIYNRAYVWRPWHRFYAIPPVNYCVINTFPYRQFYTPVRHIWYRPYRNNVRYFNVNSRRGNAQFGRRDARLATRYSQTPRNGAERNIQRTVQRRNAEITRTRSTRLAQNSSTMRSRTNRTATLSNRSATRNVERGMSTRSTNREGTISRSRTTRNSNTTSTRSNTRMSAPNRTSRINNNNTRSRNLKENVTRSRSSVSNKRIGTKNTSVRKPKATSTRSYNKGTSQNKRSRSTIQNKRKSSSVSTRSSTSRRNNQGSTRSSSR